MPKQVDHGERRREISGAAAHIATTRGLGGLSFREVAAEAGVSVSLVQHYFGTKDQLLVDTLDIQSGALGAAILERLAALGSDARPLQRIRAILSAFLPADEQSRGAMLLYLGFAGAALTDPALRRADAFRNAGALRNTIAAELSRAAEMNGLVAGVDPRTEALTLVATVLGLSLAVLLDQLPVDEATAAIDARLSLLTRS